MSITDTTDNGEVYFIRRKETNVYKNVSSLSLCFSFTYIYRASCMQAASTVNGETGTEAPTINLGDAALADTQTQTEETMVNQSNLFSKLWLIRAIYYTELWLIREIYFLSYG